MGGKALCLELLARLVDDTQHVGEGEQNAREVLILKLSRELVQAIGQHVPVGVGRQQRQCAPACSSARVRERQRRTVGPAHAQEAVSQRGVVAQFLDHQVPPARVHPPDSQRCDPQEVCALCGKVVPFEVGFARMERFPGVLYLVPEPADSLRGLTLTIAERWPEAPPYGGLHDDVVPHLTVACADDATLDAVEAELTPRLPLTGALTAARLYLFDGAVWQPRAELPFQALAASDSLLGL